MEHLHTADRNAYIKMSNQELNDAFVVKYLFARDEVCLTYTDVDRAIVGSAVPVSKPLILATPPALSAEYFCQRRELGIINIGGPGTIEIDGATFSVDNKDSLYVAKESHTITFASDSGDTPAKYYLISYPAHRVTETCLVKQENAKKISLGEQKNSNKRVIYQSLCPATMDSCQLVMGITEIADGNVWNTKPPHTHDRRTEIYMYFDLPQEERVFHYMGKPSDIRSVIMTPETAIASPPWSIHSGVGSTNYSFIWAMGGENQEFDDMDHLTLADLR